ncbi:TPA: hypothetical protein SAY52_005485 [Burkholderia cenocepacia]|uniref:hypothetical protein n=1 Tax=unclassified Burkholderia TaxID=2613784 RepID=UPI00158E9050|nr:MULTISPECIES: hypothetical protein [unclassified Burkholderia]HEF5874806.1 hypothetical protein [Burkholderia cenocepacia]
MKRAWTIAHFAFVALLIVIGYVAITCVAIAIFRANVEPKDFWTAIGVPVNALVALGTFGAAGIALWAALSDRRQRRNDELVIARLTAAGKVHILTRSRELLAAATFNVDQAVSIAQRTTEAGYPKSKIPAFDTRNRQCALLANTAHSQLESLDMLTYEEIRDLVGMPHNCAMHIATAQAQQREAIRLLKFAGQSGLATQFRDKCLNESRVHLANAKTSLDEAIWICGRETQKI